MLFRSLLEEAERAWDDEQNLEVTINVIFSDSVMANGATLPSGFEKHIRFLEDNTTKCFYFPNIDPTKDWEEYEVDCND